MASSFLLPPPHLISTIVICLVLLSCFGPVSCKYCYKSIFNFGDSGSDTGNLYFPNDNTSYASHLPYGETYFHRATGRFSDGRLIIDFLAEAAGLPHFLPPFLGGADSNESDRFRYGANFAVVAATALGADYYKSVGMPSLSNYTLSVQLGWFKRLLPSLATSDSDREELLNKSLFVVGAIGGNDYNYLIYLRQLDRIRPTIPASINATSSAITELIDLGARTLLVPGLSPSGCLATFLTLFPGNTSDDYDRNGCLKSFNELSEYYNGLLQTELDRLRKLYPYATIIYGDYYNAAYTVYSSPQSFGFGTKPLVACCGSGGSYNYNQTVPCGSAMSNLCENPSKQMCWDGIHSTEAANKAFFNILSNGSFAELAINNKCHQRFELLLAKFGRSRKYLKEYY